MNAFLLEDLIEVLGCNMPALIMLIVGMSVTWTNWNRHPPAARWAMLAFIWLFCTDVGSILWMRMGIVVVFPNIAPHGPEEVLSMAILSCCEATGYIFFLLALNAVRKPHRPRTDYDELDDIDIRRHDF
ncbi:MAG TPA: hypothetical protein VFE62_05540 [Gemmataceae bacterium]|nr:hypothetical protein [Gemmataceae bacterium]